MCCLFVQMKKRKSLVHRYSARYVVQQDYSGDCKRLFSTPIRKISDKTSNYNEDAATYTMSEDTSLQAMDIEQVKKSFDQVHIRVLLQTHNYVIPLAVKYDENNFEEN